jgi:hypothetical protein
VAGENGSPVLEELDLYHPEGGEQRDEDGLVDQVYK